MPPSPQSAGSPHLRKTLPAAALPSRNPARVRPGQVRRHQCTVRPAGFLAGAGRVVVADLDAEQLPVPGELRGDVGRATVEWSTSTISTGDEQTAAQLATCAQVWEQAGEDGAGRAWERRWRSFPRLLVVLVGISAAQVRSAVADLRLAAEENPATADMLAAIPADAARLEHLIQRGTAAPIWHPLSDGGRRACGWTEL